jgi:hypothetical protein
VSQRAIRLVLRDPDLHRSRLTVGFRLILVIPLLIWLAVWFSLAVLVSIANWIATLITGEPSPMLHRFLAAYVRYAAHVGAYVLLAADGYPPFTGRVGYAVDVEIDPPGRQNRWTTGFRLILALPAILLADVLVGFGSTEGGGAAGSAGVAVTAAFLGWFYVIAHGRITEGLRDLVIYAIGYTAQVYGYLFLLTGRYPNSDPGAYESANVYRADPVRLTVDDDLRRSRLMVFFRLPLAFPHFLWLLLWGVAAFFAAIANWFVTLIRGRSADGLSRFLAGFLRYQIHVYAFVQLAANPFPGFAGRAGTYPVDVETDPQGRQNRWVTGFRLLLAIPAFAILSALYGAGFLAAVYSWFHGLFRAQVPRGLRNLIAFQLRYQAQTLAYIYLLTDRYPYSGPSLGWQMSLTPEPPPAG